MRADSDNSPGAASLCIFMVLVIAYGVSQIYAGWIGIEHHFGSGWANAALVAALLIRFSLPLTVGSFFGALDVWGWHWVVAFVFAAPSIAFMALMVPGILATLFGNARGRPG